MGISVGKVLKMLAIVLVVVWVLLSFVNVITTVAPIGEQLSEITRWGGSSWGYEDDIAQLSGAIAAAWCGMFMNCVPVISLCAIQFGLGEFLERKGI